MNTKKYKSQKTTRLRILQTILNELLDSIINKQLFNSEDADVIKYAANMIIYPSTKNTQDMISEFKFDPNRQFRRKYVAYELYEIMYILRFTHGVNNQNNIFTSELKRYLNGKKDRTSRMESGGKIELDYEYLTTVCIDLMNILKTKLILGDHVDTNITYNNPYEHLILSDNNTDLLLVRIKDGYFIAKPTKVSKKNFKSGWNLWKCSNGMTQEDLFKIKYGLFGRYQSTLKLSNDSSYEIKIKILNDRHESIFNFPLIPELVEFII